MIHRTKKNYACPGCTRYRHCLGWSCVTAVASTLLLPKGLKNSHPIKSENSLSIMGKELSNVTHKKMPASLDTFGLRSKFLGKENLLTESTQ